MRRIDKFHEEVEQIHREKLLQEIEEEAKAPLSWKAWLIPAIWGCFTLICYIIHS